MFVGNLSDIVLGMLLGSMMFHDVPCVKWWFVHGSFTEGLEIPMISKFQAVKRAEMFNTVHEAGGNGGGADGPSNSGVQLGNTTQRLGPHVTWGPKR